MRIAAVQPSPDTASAARLIESAIAEFSSVILLPEKWTRQTTAAIRLAMDISTTFDGLIIPGAFESDGAVRAPLIKGGDVIAWATKSHLTNSELSKARPGLGPLLVEFRGVGLGIMICYDADFPEVARALAMRGASLFLVPSKIIYRGVDMWRIYVLARSLENRIPLVNASALDPPLFMGRSRVIELHEDNGIIIATERELGSEPGVIYYDHANDLGDFRRRRLDELRDYEVSIITA